MSERRNFLKRGIQVLLGSIFAFVALPQLQKQPAGFEAFAMGSKQLHLLLASKKLMEKTGMLRAMSIWHYANDGEIQMDWTVAIPPENQISSDTDSLAQLVIALVDQ